MEAKKLTLKEAAPLTYDWDFNNREGAMRQTEQNRSAVARSVENYYRTIAPVKPDLG